MEPQQSSAVELQTRLIQRAATDASFRHELLTNSRQAIERELGTKLPADFEVQVIEEVPNKLCLVLPMKQEQGELPDAVLAGVTGGLSSLSTILSSFYTRVYTTTLSISKPLSTSTTERSATSAASAFETGASAGGTVTAP